MAARLTQVSSDLALLFAAEPAGRRRVAAALVSGERAPTYRELAFQLHLGLGTVYTHLRRLRLRNPEAYAALAAARRWQLMRRHVAATARAAAHSAEWHRRQANRRYFYRFGYWPWERGRSFDRLGRPRGAVRGQAQ